MGGDHHQPPDQKTKDQHQKDCPDQPGLLTDNGKYHIILRLRHEPQLLQTASQSLSEDSPAPDRIETLDCLKPLIIALRIPPDGQAFQPVTLQTQKYGDKSDSCPSDADKLHILRI